MIEFTEYRSQHQRGLIDLILHIQREEYHLPITLEDQPDLKSVEAFYLENGGFWVALDDSAVIGSVAIKNLGSGDAMLRKMFVRKDFRGKELGVSGGLLKQALDWARRGQYDAVYLGTTPEFLAAHRFYEKNGFTEIRQEKLPESFPIMAVDKKFYRCDLKAEY